MAAVLRVLGAALCLAALVQVELASAADDRRVAPLRMTRYMRHRRPPPPPAKDAKLGEARASAVLGWVDAQLLDHFDPTVNATWRQRYWSNDGLYEKNGPVFIFIEGESEASSSWIERGNSFMYTLASELKAKQYVLEHRFFGESKPTKDISTENLKWLSTDQALADLAYFIEFLIEKKDISRNDKVVVFGGSYPGNLAAWARIKYPHLIHAAVASSAPVHAKEDFLEYFEVVTRSIKTIAGFDCANNLIKAFNRIKKLAMTTDGLATLKNKFYMCNTLNTTNKLDMDLFYEILSNPFAGAAQYNRDNSYAQYSLKAQCEPLQGSLSDDDAVDKLAKVFTNSQGFIWGCIDWSYAGNTGSLTSTKYAGGDRQWVYMTCVSFGYFQTADGDTSFPKGYFDVDYFLQECKDAFGDAYDDAMVKKGVARTNIVFGDLRPDVTNVMFVNGDIDPWHALGITAAVNPTSPAILIEGTSHCYDMYPNQYDDPPNLLAAREKIRKFVYDSLFEEANSGVPTLAP